MAEKQHLFDEVWHDVIVSDAALTQCIKDIRKQLGDEAKDPHFIKTIPRHGYRFVYEPIVDEPESPHAPSSGADSPAPTADEAG